MADALETGELTVAAESVRDYIERIDTPHTVFLSNIGTSDASAMKEEWPERSYEAPADNAQYEAGAAPTAVPNQPNRPRNFVQTFARTAEVTTASDAVKKYGMATAFADEIEQKLIAVRRDVEYAAIGRITEYGGNDNATATTAGLEVTGSFPARTASFHAQLDASVRDATGGDFSEGHVRAGQQAIFDGTKDAGTSRILLVKPADMVIVDDFSGRVEVAGTDAGGATRQRQVNSSTVDIAVQRFVTSFGPLTAMPSAHILATTGIIFDPAMTDLCTLNPLDYEEIDAGTAKVRKAEVYEQSTTRVLNSFSGCTFEGLN